jgi:predicted outer membrane repeat protein
MNIQASSPIVRLLVVAALCLAALPVPRARAAGVRRYVRVGGKTTGACTSWASACDLQYALTSVAVSGDEIWVRGGVYLPDPADETVSFGLVDGVAMYGGFSGTETKLSQRSPSQHVTVLSGDTGNLGDATDNSDHVVSGRNLGPKTVLDGFAIKGGDTGGFGAGLNLLNSAPTLHAIMIVGNTATEGGGLYSSDGSPNLSEVTFSGNRAELGAGMYSAGAPAAHLEHVTFIDNHAYGDGGGLMEEGGSFITLSNVSFAGNDAQGSGGGMVVATGSTASLDHVQFVGNAARSGGGLKSSDTSQVHIKRGLFLGNQAADAGGLLVTSNSSAFVTRTTFRDNQAYNTGSGGGAYIQNAFAALSKVTFDGNTADDRGGALYAFGSAPTLTDVTFDSNTAASGGGAYLDSAPAVLTRITFHLNKAISGGGGLAVSQSAAQLENITFNGNNAPTGGALFNTAAATPTMTYVTLSGNTGSIGAGIYSNSGHPRIDDSIIWANGVSEVLIAGGTATIDNSDLKGPCPGGATCTGTINKDPKLGSLKKHGGFTKTMALKPGSPAIDAVSCLPGIKTDQRGVKRPQGPKCDMGAYEYVP